MLCFHKILILLIVVVYFIHYLKKNQGGNCLNLFLGDFEQYVKINTKNVYQELNIIVESLRNIIIIDAGLNQRLRRHPK